MPGFIASIGNSDIRIPAETRLNMVINRMEFHQNLVERRTVNKFMNDKLFVESKDLLIVIEGVVLNNHLLMKQYQTDSWQQCVEKMYSQCGDTFFNEFRGSFSGLLYDKQSNKWIVYTDHIGDKQVFYTQTPTGYIFGSEIGFLAETRKLNGWENTLDKTAEYMAISIGWCIEDKTLIKEIHKLAPGHYYKLMNDKLEELQYHRFSNTPQDISIDDAIEEIDSQFRHAVQMQFDKDVEYGYKHIACLSGGLDSRMTVWVAHQLGYDNQLNITFSQSNYRDFTIAQQIATDLKHDFLFKALDGGNCIYDIDNVTKLTYGNGNFFSVSHGKSMNDLINFDQYGIIHTGQLGDVILGTFLSSMDYVASFSVADRARSIELIHRLDDYKFRYQYANAEIYRMYTRGFGGTAQGLLSDQENTESVSPFCDVDFMEFCWSLPLLLRFHHKIYIDWILKKYPEAARYIWETTGKMITPIDNTPRPEQQHTYMSILGYKVPAFADSAFPEYIKGFILRRLGLRKKVSAQTPIEESSHTRRLLTAQDMNPVDYWYETNEKLKSFMDAYWYNYKNIVEDKQLQQDMAYLYEQCDAVYDKLQVLSLLSAIKLIKS